MITVDELKAVFGGGHGEDKDDNVSWKRHRAGRQGRRTQDPNPSQKVLLAGSKKQATTTNFAGEEDAVVSVCAGRWCRYVLAVIGHTGHHACRNAAIAGTKRMR